MKLSNILTLALFLIASSAYADRYPVEQQKRDVACFESITAARKVKAWDGYYIEDGKISNIFNELNVSMNKIKANPLVSSETKENLDLLKSQFANYYQCDEVGNPIPEQKKGDLPTTLKKYNHFCLITKDGIKKYSLESLKELQKNLSGASVIPVGWVYNSYINLATSKMESLVKVEKLSPYDQNRIEVVIFQKGLPKSNIKDIPELKTSITKNCPDTYINSSPAVVSAPIEEAKPKTYAPTQRRRPGSR